MNIYIKENSDFMEDYIDILGSYKSFYYKFNIEHHLKNNISDLQDYIKKLDKFIDKNKNDPNLRKNLSLLRYQSEKYIKNSIVFTNVYEHVKTISYDTPKKPVCTKNYRLKDICGKYYLYNDNYKFIVYNTETEKVDKYDYTDKLNIIYRSCLGTNGQLYIYGYSIMNIIYENNNIISNNNINGYFTNSFSRCVLFNNKNHMFISKENALSTTDYCYYKILVYGTKSYKNTYNSICLLRSSVKIPKGFVPIRLSDNGSIVAKDLKTHKEHYYRHLTTEKEFLRQTKLPNDIITCIEEYCYPIVSYV